MQEALVWFLGQEGPLEKGETTHSSTVNFFEVKIKVIYNHQIYAWYSFIVILQDWVCKVNVSEVFFLSRGNICNSETLTPTKNHFLNLGFVGQVVRLFPGGMTKRGKFSP